MSVNTSDLRSGRSAAQAVRRGAVAARRPRENFSTALFTGLNIAVFTILAASVVGAAILYSQGA